MISVVVVVGLLAAIWFVLAPLFREQCPLCEGRNTEKVPLLYPANRKSYVCYDCHMWFDLKNKNNP